MCTTPRLQQSGRRDSFTLCRLWVDYEVYAWRDDEAMVDVGTMVGIGFPKVKSHYNLKETTQPMATKEVQKLFDNVSPHAVIVSIQRVQGRWQGRGLLFHARE